jgi:hypothetical protein
MESENLSGRRALRNSLGEGSVECSLGLAILFFAIGYDSLLEKLLYGAKISLGEMAGTTP